MMVIHRDTGMIEHRHFCDLPEYVREGDHFILNDTRVVPARYFSNDGSIEIVRAEVLNPLLWKCMVRPGRKMKLGRTVAVGEAVGTVEGIDEEGYRLIRFDREVDEEKYGRLALPHYMNRESDPSDRERYQTVYARHEGAIAAPTAGLHFTPELLASVPHDFLTLHVGVGTFRPVKADRIEDHQMHTEHFFLPEAAARAVNNARRVIAVGTTSVRVLEHVATAEGLPLRPENTVIKICRVLHHKAGKFLQTQKPVLFNVPLMGHPVPDNPVKIRDHHVRPAVPGCPYHKAGGVRCDPVVAVQKLDECSPGL